MVFRSFLILLLSVAVMGCSKNESSETVAFPSTQSFGFSCKASGDLTPKALYGSDDRLDWVDSPGITKDYWAQSTLALMNSRNLVDEGDSYRVDAESYGDAVNLCPNQKFSEQPSAAFCSGFLVSPDLIVTAGHCIQSLSDCRGTEFVFDFAKKEANQTDYRIKKEDVYSCKEIVAQSVGDQDYAVVRLDRNVTDRTPINIRRSGTVNIGQTLMLIGHPMGIPSKIAEGGSVMSVGSVIRASVDAFASNSGSVILNMSTGDVEGILVAGETDFTFQNGCRVEYRCGEECGGEVITPISVVEKYIPNIQYDNPACPK